MVESWFEWFNTPKSKGIILDYGDLTTGFAKSCSVQLKSISYQLVSDLIRGLVAVDKRRRGFGERFNSCVVNTG